MQSPYPFSAIVGHEELDALEHHHLENEGMLEERS